MYQNYNAYNPYGNGYQPYMNCKNKYLKKLDNTGNMPAMVKQEGDANSNPEQQVQQPMMVN